MTPRCVTGLKEASLPRSVNPTGLSQIPLSIIAIAATACGAVTVVEESETRPTKPISLESDSQEGSPGKVDFIPSDTGAQQMGERRRAAPDDESTREESAPAGPFQMRLPKDELFLSTPFPPVAPSRYLRWKEKGRIAVKQSHLQHLAVIQREEKILVMSGEENAVRVYDRSSKALLVRHPVPEIERFGRADLCSWPDVDPEPLFLLAKADGLWLCNARHGDMTRLYGETAIHRLRWSPDQTVLVAARYDFDTQTAALLFFYRGDPHHLALLGELSFKERVDAWDLSRDNRYLVASYYPSNTMAIIDLHSGNTVWQIATPEFGGDVALSPDGATVAMGGSSLLLVDTTNPDRRTLYTQFQNNIAKVGFSPSGDALLTASYDGKIRIFSYDVAPLKLTRIKTLSHRGSANVYDFRFVDNGWGLVSVSGDQTIGFWGGRRLPEKDPARNGATWHPLNLPVRETIQQLKTDSGTSSRSDRLAVLTSLYNTPRHHPALLDEPPRPSRIAPGAYACKVAKEYRFRDCVVETLPSGHTILEVKEGNILPIRGVLYNDGPVVRFEGWTTAKRPFKCFSCQERCFLDPEACFCTPNSADRIRSCLRQPVHAVFKGSAGNWKGVLLYFGYYDEQLQRDLPPADFKYMDGNNQFIIELRKR